MQLRISLQTQDYKKPLKHDTMDWITMDVFQDEQKKALWNLEFDIISNQAHHATEV